MTVVFTEVELNTLQKQYYDRSPGRFLADKRAAQNMESSKSKAERAGRVDRRLLSGEIPSKSVQSDGDRLDQGNKISPATASVVSGIIAATVSTNRVMPLASEPSTWDVLACKHAILTGSFSGFRLPTTHPSFRLGDYASGLMSAEFDDDALERDPPKQNLKNVRNNNSYEIRGLARCNQAGLDGLLAASDASVDVVDLHWAGPWYSGEQYLMSVDIGNHTIDGSVYTHTPSSGNLSVTVPLVDVVEVGDYALIDISFISIEGGKWQAFMTRVK